MSKEKLILRIHGLGEIPSFKNKKMLTRGKIITNPKKQKWMDRAAASLSFQLRSWFQTRGIEIQTGRRALSLIVSWMPLDDSLFWIGNLSVNWRKAPKGQEGALIKIERI